MARTGSVVKLQTLSTSPGLAVGWLKTPKLGFTDGVSDAAVRYLQLDGSSDVQVTDDSDVEGGFLRGASLKAASGPLTNLDAAGTLNSLANVTTKNLDQITDGTTYKKVKSVSSSNEITNASVSATAAISGAKLSAGAGPLTNLSAAGVFNSLANVTTKTLDQVSDGSTYKRVSGVSSGLVQTASIASSAVTFDKMSSSIVRAYRSTNQNVTNGTTIIFNTESYDGDSAYNHTTGVYTVPATGTYLISTTARFNNVDASEYVYVSVYVNSGYRRVSSSPYSPAANQPVFVGGTWPLALTAGDTVAIKGHHNHTADSGVLVVSGVSGTLEYTQLAIFRLR